MMQEKPEEELIHSKPVIELLTVANEYCLFFEKAESYSTGDILGYFQKMAPLLYLKGSTLPNIKATDDSFKERFVTEEQWEQVFKVLREKLGSEDIFYHLDHNADSVQASLAEKLSDIYQDMKDFVMLYQKNHLHARENAVAEVHALFANHWGPRIIDALKACHHHIYKDLIDPELFDDLDLKDF